MGSARTSLCAVAAVGGGGTASQRRRLGCAAQRYSVGGVPRPCNSARQPCYRLGLRSQVSVLVSADEAAAFEFSTDGLTMCVTMRRGNASDDCAPALVGVHARASRLAHSAPRPRLPRSGGDALDSGGTRRPPAGQQLYRQGLLLCGPAGVGAHMAVATASAHSVRALPFPTAEEAALVSMRRRFSGRRC